MKKDQMILLIVLAFYIAILSTVFCLDVNYPSLELSQISVSLFASAPLVIVTIWYAYDTHRIVQEGQKDREVRAIESRLERLYYPLRNIIQDCGSDFNCFRSLSKPFRNELYLASIELRELYDEHYDHETAELYKKIVALVKGEIDSMQKRLEELTTIEKEKRRS